VIEEFAGQLVPERVDGTPHPADNFGEQNSPSEKISRLRGWLRGFTSVSKVQLFAVVCPSARIKEPRLGRAQPLPKERPDSLLA